MPSTNYLPLVLVQNEVTLMEEHARWLDITGQQYHYPNQYRNRVQEGRLFVYYRGVRRVGGERGTAEYFGVGRIGRIWLDESVPPDARKADRQWFCAIEDYVPFASPVPAKIGAAYFEQVTNPRDWGTGVREIEQATCDAILRAAGMPPPPLGVVVPAPLLPPIDTVNAREASDLLVPVSPRPRREAGSGGSARRSPNATIYGRRAEEIVYRHLLTRTPPLSKLRWMSEENEQPGWDIQHHDAGRLVAIEVKGTSAEHFVAVELTANEWCAAEERREQYFVYLVTSCASSSPKIQIVQNPWLRVSDGTMSAVPAVWRLSLNEQPDPDARQKHADTGAQTVASECNAASAPHPV